MSSPICSTSCVKVLQTALQELLVTSQDAGQKIRNLSLLMTAEVERNFCGTGISSSWPGTSAPPPPGVWLRSSRNSAARGINFLYSYPVHSADTLPREYTKQRVNFYAK